MQENNRTAIVIPVYNDWQSCAELLKQIEKIEFKEEIEIVLVNDCSTEQIGEISTSFKVNTLNLKANVGHQRAIAIGLAHCYNSGCFSEVIIMDSDGEDNPKYIPELLKVSRETNKIVFAKRIKRQEGFIFKFLYSIYKLIFKLLVGRTISFGNFSALNKESLNKIIFTPDLWNHLSSTIIKSRIPYTTIDTSRDKRYFGESKMNLSSLVIHGFSAISIFIENVFTRIIFATLMVFGLSISLSGFVVYRKFFLGIASPGWATTSLLGFIVISLLMLVFCFLLGLSYLNNRKAQLDVNFLRDNYTNFLVD